MTDQAILNRRVTPNTGRTTSKRIGQCSAKQLLELYNSGEVDLVTSRWIAQNIEMLKGSYHERETIEGKKIQRYTKKQNERN